MKTLQICPPYLSDAATLPWEIQKVIYQIKGGRLFLGHGVYSAITGASINAAHNSSYNNARSAFSGPPTAR